MMPFFWSRKCQVCIHTHTHIYMIMCRSICAICICISVFGYIYDHPHNFMPRIHAYAEILVDFLRTADPSLAADAIFCSCGAIRNTSALGKP